MPPMRRIFWLGSPFFSASLAGRGWQISTHTFNEARIFTWEDIVRLADGIPDVLVVADKSHPPFVLGMEDFPCLTIFYAVDSHIHSWQPHYAQGFDIVMVSLHDHVPLFYNARLPQSHVWWSPPYARDDDAPRPDISPQWDCLFVGTHNPDILPRRARFLTELATHIPDLHTTRGDYRTLFAQGKILLNQCEHDDCNFRIFEALGCGGCLVSPRIGHALTDMFIDGEHLTLYTPHDAKDAAEKIRILVHDPAQRARLATAGLAAVDRGHRAHHRARTFIERVEQLWPHAHDGIRARQAAAHDIRRHYLRVPYLLWAKETPQQELQQAYLTAAQGKSIKTDF